MFSRAALGLSLCAWLCAVACGSDDRKAVGVPDAKDAGPEPMTPMTDPTKGCVDVELDGTTVVEHLADFTATFEAGTSYDRTVMLFGGGPVEQPNTPRRAYIYAMDKVDAQMMAKKYPDFYLCSSVGGQEASTYIRVYDLVPATCQIHQQLVAALRVYNANVTRGGDRTSLRLEGAPLTVKSVTADTTGEDVSAQVSGQQFHVITKVQQLTGESVLDFGTKN